MTDEQTFYKNSNGEVVERVEIPTNLAKLELDIYTMQQDLAILIAKRDLIISVE